MLLRSSRSLPTASTSFSALARRPLLPRHARPRTLQDGARRRLCSSSSNKPPPASSSSSSAASSSSASASSTTTSAAGIAMQRLKSPVTWLSATGTLGALYGLYEFQKQRQMNAQYATGKPDLGGSFSLVDADGKKVTSESLEGQWVLLYFGFTKCPDICPEELFKVSGVLARLEVERSQPIQPVFITIDPARDTQARLKAYFTPEQGFHPKFIGLTGTFEQVKKACRAYRVYFTKPTDDEIKKGDYLLDHSIISYLVTPNGDFADYYGKSLSADEMFERVSKYISDWERRVWWDSIAPKWLASPQATEGQKRAVKAANL